MPEHSYKPSELSLPKLEYTGTSLGGARRWLLPDAEINTLIKPELGGNRWVPEGKLTRPGNIAHARTTMRFGDNPTAAKRVNNALLASEGTGTTVVKAVLGVAIGAASIPFTAGTGLLMGAAWTASTTSISVANSSQRVLARDRDVAVQVEMIGTYESEIWHVSTIILSDPYRSHKSGKGSPQHAWLIDEEWTELDVTVADGGFF